MNDGDSIFSSTESSRGASGRWGFFGRIFRAFENRVREREETVDTRGAGLAGELAVAPHGVEAVQANSGVDTEPPDYEAVAQLTEQTAQSVEALGRNLVKLEEAVRQIQSRLDTNR